MLDIQVSKNNHIHEHITNRNTVVNVKSNLEESAKLLNDLEQQAIKRIVSSFNIENSLFKARLIRFTHNNDCIDQYLCAIKLNNKDLIVKYETPFRRNCHSSNYEYCFEVLQAVRDAVAKAISEKITESFMNCHGELLLDYPNLKTMQQGNDVSDSQQEGNET